MEGYDDSHSYEQQHIVCCEFYHYKVAAVVSQSVPSTGYGCHSYNQFHHISTVIKLEIAIPAHYDNELAV